jgi:hypothetical protein
MLEETIADLLIQADQDGKAKRAEISKYKAVGGNSYRVNIVVSVEPAASTREKPPEAPKKPGRKKTSTKS